LRDSALIELEAIATFKILFLIRTSSPAIKRFPAFRTEGDSRTSFARSVSALKGFNLFGKFAQELCLFSKSFENGSEC
jgi:hypothetical protein